MPVFLVCFGDIHPFNIDPAVSRDLNELEVLARLASGRLLSSSSSSSPSVLSSNGGVGERRRLRRTARGPALSASRWMKPFHQRAEKFARVPWREGVAFRTHLSLEASSGGKDRIPDAVVLLVVQHGCLHRLASQRYPRCRMSCSSERR